MTFSFFLYISSFRHLRAAENLVSDEDTDDTESDEEARLLPNRVGCVNESNDIRVFLT